MEHRSDFSEELEYMGLGQTAEAYWIIVLIKNIWRQSMKIDELKN